MPRGPGRDHAPDDGEAARGPVWLVRATDRGPGSDPQVRKWLEQRGRVGPAGTAQLRGTRPVARVHRAFLTVAVAGAPPSSIPEISLANLPRDLLEESAEGTFVRTPGKECPAAFPLAWEEPPRPGTVPRLGVHPGGRQARCADFRPYLDHAQRRARRRVPALRLPDRPVRPLGAGGPSGGPPAAARNPRRIRRSRSPMKSGASASRSWTSRLAHPCRPRSTSRRPLPRRLPKPAAGSSCPCGPSPRTSNGRLGRPPTPSRSSRPSFPSGPWRRSLAGRRSLDPGSAGPGVRDPAVVPTLRMALDETKGPSRSPTKGRFLINDLRIPGDNANGPRVAGFRPIVRIDRPVLEPVRTQPGVVVLKGKTPGARLAGSDRQHPRSTGLADVLVHVLGCQPDASELHHHAGQPREPALLADSCRGIGHARFASPARRNIGPRAALLGHRAGRGSIDVAMRDTVLLGSQGPIVRDAATGADHRSSTSGASWPAEALSSR